MPKQVRVLRQMARVLSLDPVIFTESWFRSFEERCIGYYPSLEDNLFTICRSQGVITEHALVRKAAQKKYDYTLHQMRPESEIINVLEQLMQRKYKIGLISNCSSEIPFVWNQTELAPYFDQTIFSCIEGIKKPDMQIFLTMASRLGFKPDQCLYVGDGDDDELTGASKAGMNTMLVNKSDTSDSSYDDNTIDYQIGSVMQLMEILKE